MILAATGAEIVRVTLCYAFDFERKTDPNPFDNRSGVAMVEKIRRFANKNGSEPYDRRAERVFGFI